MARRQSISKSERESLLALPYDELTLTRMAYFSEHDLALINAHRKPASRFGFAVLFCYLKNVGFAPDKKTPLRCIVKAHSQQVKTCRWAMVLLYQRQGDYATRAFNRVVPLSWCKSIHQQDTAELYYTSVANGDSYRQGHFLGGRNVGLPLAKQGYVSYD